jgi:hypothetical protein
MSIPLSVAQSDGRSRLARRAWFFMKRARAIRVLSRGGSLTCTANVCTSLMAGTPVRRDTDRQKSGYGPELTRAGSPPGFWTKGIDLVGEGVFGILTIDLNPACGATICHA